MPVETGNVQEIEAVSDLLQNDAGVTLKSLGLKEMEDPCQNTAGTHSSCH